MTPSLPAAAPIAWHLLTRLGELQIMLPALLVAAWSLRRTAPRLAGRWLIAAAAAIVLAAASKVAFIGYGWGWAALDFTGVSGHALMAAAVLPMLLQLTVQAWTERARGAGLVLGTGLALAVAVSRVRLNAHSPSEAVAGLVLGGLVSAVALAAGRTSQLHLPRALPLALLAAILLAAAQAPPSRSHDVVTRLALAMSGRSHPYTRWQMHHDRDAAAAVPRSASN